ncbi:hypothetical protein K6U06_12975 [Acidiferrimicrobium sp. IK]|uniref:hypothetical protein n=1 Tax=Acidiferrimicrobium sp. IK TaxID=2871700 RepID=UPI0021CB1181|nr:hypothetical protein [Acidiferrimicrobium sp. IK]MCU4185280.1 hypothetical protein [Acidiferrimicrobium sp. IK]
MAGISPDGQPRRVPVTARLSTRGYGRVGLAGVVVAAVLAVTFATGYTSTRLLSNDSSAWLRKGVTVAEINGPSARYEAVASASPTSVAARATDPLQVVQTPDGQLYTDDPRTGKVYRIDMSTMTPEPGPEGTAVLARGAHVFVVDGKHRTLTPVDPQSLAPGRPVTLPAPVASQAIAGDGTAYIGATNGEVTTVAGSSVHTVQVTAHPEPVDMSVVGSSPVAVDPTAGVLYNLAGPKPVPVRLPGPAASPLELASSQPAGPVWLVQGDALVEVNLPDGGVQSAQLPAGDGFGPPVINAGRVYVPDDTRGQVLVFDSASRTPEPAIDVPAGAPGSSSIEVVVKDGAVWIDNPTSRDGKLVGADGSVRTIDKSTGDGVTDPNAKPASKAPIPAPQPTASPQPPVSPQPVIGSQPGSLPAATSALAVPAPQAPPAGPAPTAPIVAPPVVPAATTVAPTTTTTRPTTTTTQPPGPAEVTVPTDLVGQKEQAACAELQADRLACSEQLVATAAPSGQADDVVTATPGGKVPPGTKITLSVDEVAVPAIPAGASPSAYCAAANTDYGFVCTSTSDGAAPAGTQPDVVTKVTPDSPGTLVAPGTPIVAHYYTPTPPPAPVVVPDCVGAPYQNCAATGLTVNAVVAPTPTAAVNCPDVYQQSPAAGTTVPPGSALTLDYDPVCAAPLYEQNHIGTNVFFLTFDASSWPSGLSSEWTHPTGAGADAYQLQGGACPKAGTVPLYEFEYLATGTNSGNRDHFYFTTRRGFAAKGWTAKGAMACVFPSQVAGTVPVYANYLNDPSVPADYVWTPNTPNSNTPNPVWYQPQHP